MADRKLLNIELGRVKADVYRDLPPSGVVLVLDNIRSAHNVGSAFRTGDAFKVDRVYLCGICAVPPSAEIHKVALGAELSMPWEHADDTLALVERLKSEGYRIVCAEQTEHAVPLQQFRREPWSSETKSTASDRMSWTPPTIVWKSRSTGPSTRSM